MGSSVGSLIAASALQGILKYRLEYDLQPQGLEHHGLSMLYHPAYALTPPPPSSSISPQSMCFEGAGESSTWHHVVRVFNARLTHIMESSHPSALRKLTIILQVPWQTEFQGQYPTSFPSTVREVDQANFWTRWLLQPVLNLTIIPVREQNKISTRLVDESWDLSSDRREVGDYISRFGKFQQDSGIYAAVLCGRWLHYLRAFRRWRGALLTHDFLGPNNVKRVECKHISARLQLNLKAMEEELGLFEQHPDPGALFAVLQTHVAFLTTYAFVMRLACPKELSRAFWLVLRESSPARYAGASAFAARLHL
jgi:hypothetical protein